MSYTYNGLGDRVSQTVNGITTNFTLDLNSGLTQVLQESSPLGAYTYLYGAERIAQVGASSTDYFLADAQGSVRQLTTASGGLTLAKNYLAFGDVSQTVGTGSSRYGYTGEQRPGEESTCGQDTTILSQADHLLFPKLSGS